MWINKYYFLVKVNKNVGECLSFKSTLSLHARQLAQPSTNIGGLGGESPRYKRNML